MKKAAPDPYADIAAIYEQANHVESATGFFDTVGPMIEQQAKHGCVLDMGCGTGLISQMAARRGMRVLGIDRSEPMLKLARRRCRSHAKNVRFICDDLTTFSVRETCVAAYAGDDVFNHFPPTVIGPVLARVHQQLAPGGMVIFDTLNRFCFREYWTDRTYFLESDAGDMVMECDWDDDESIGSVRFLCYVRNGSKLEKRDVSFVEYLHENSAVRQALSNAGFHRIQRTPWSPWSDQHLERSMDRNLWTAWKKE